jgi:hypothetical protein
MIERNGVMYTEAIDPAELNRVYIETDTLIEKEYDVEEELASKKEQEEPSEIEEV